MSVRIDLNSSRWIKSQFNTTERKLIRKQNRIIELLDYDICISFLFNDSRNLAFVRGVSSKDNHSCQDMIPSTLFLNKRQYNSIKELIDKKDKVENHYHSSLPLLLENIKSEVLIPIFKYDNIDNLSMKLIGCLYLGSNIYKEFPSGFFSEDKEINEKVSDISKLLTLCLARFEQISDAINMIDIFIDILEQKDPYLSNHSYNVANWCREIGMELGFSREELNQLAFAGLLHDLGKCMIDSKVLNKPETLTEEEYAIIKYHILYSYKISKNLLGHIEGLDDIPRIIKYHHERYDGKGYPSGLKGDEVPFESYIIGISDSVDAMLTNKPYKKAMPINAVIRELYREKGKQFHPQLVDIMVDRLTKAQNQLKETHYHTVGLSSLIISYEEKVIIIEGALFNMGNYYIFNPDEESKVDGIDLSKIANVEMVVKKLNNLNYYEIKLEDLIDNTFYISSIKLIPSPNTFNLLWNLEGILYWGDGNRKTPIEIIRIGGDALSFSLHDNWAIGIPIGKPLKVKILFEEYDIDITGSILKSYDFGPYKYFDLHYTNIPDSKRDAIYRQLFRKQIELRKTISEYRI
ncbi:HD-GYP domain-containing protein [Schnuerera ultunensis]|uniref:HD-GYP domain-containing protein n=1 Tax=Schnuerera ultunensis TaxID=45497 RepID=UPI00046F5905|nr:HD-GYP domain-containing protein [Schnuerera ultunensis]